MPGLIRTRPFRHPAAFMLGSAILALTAPAAETQDQPAWIAKSNENAQVLVKNLAKFSPEFASRVGVAGFDDKIADLTPGV